jgi:hypothetical protein
MLDQVCARIPDGGSSAHWLEGDLSALVLAGMAVLFALMPTEVRSPSRDRSGEKANREAARLPPRRREGASGRGVARADE